AAEERGQISGRDVYMKEHGVSREEAIQVYEERIENAWKLMNEGWMRPTPVARRLPSLAYNFGCQGDVLYKEDDGLSRPEKTSKHLVTKLFIDPIPLEE
ncbi:Terpenoid synthase, partial [Corchorus olitorius]